jgi:hypothetical protein
MEWLERFSPMKIHWARKWLTIPYGSTFITLQGLLPDSLDCAVIELSQITSNVNVDKNASIPEEIQTVLQQFHVVFDSPTDLPPRRFCDHTIPLIPRAHPVQSKPYRYAPALKDEIERLVQEMLQAGIIQPSDSAFSSPVLLVKKKDGSWRFCINYRRLNALTLKGKFPLPIIDELMELCGASWFSKLDLRVGYHQIHLAPREGYKTTFQTHS